MVILIKKFRIISISLFVLSILINIIAGKIPSLVEKYYSNGINIYIVKIMSKIFSIFPCSIFEILIYISLLSVLVFLIYSIYYIMKKPNNILSYLKNSFLNIISIVGIVYFLFVVLWGLNYNRMNLKDSLIVDYNKSHNENIKDVDYDKEDLINLYKFLIEKCNDIRAEVLEDEQKVMKCNTDYKEVLNRANNGYENVSILNLNKRGSYAPAKPILNSNLLCYTGITGIYSPFTGEANVNTGVPDIYIPFTTLHEMAHQRGYGSEDECNFLAYIACINNEDYDFQYSGYILALKYTASALAKVDYDALVSLNGELSSSVINDLNYSREFWKQYEGKVNEVSDNMNSNYLKANGVEEGTLSYGKVVNLLLVYYSLYGFN
ncbi:MAG: DUF3810 domain-containing protein [Terrisporobacter othiniensis]|uniref:DUF3810 domain-containing protein n=1 Tax=Terrisporobacter othiniensis TaxID=1577792 RepID=UPI0029078590|nr:DUF3810 domain-containing protein [Terrisporobacter othiniensis]MDU6984160.1 DUF3810 domain-containing protein [Terrisporobacter othiniensis]